MDPIKIEIEVKVVGAAEEEKERVDLNRLALLVKCMIEILESYPKYSPNGEPDWLIPVRLSDILSLKNYAYGIEYILEEAAKKAEKEPHPLQPLVDLIDKYYPQSGGQR